MSMSSVAGNAKRQLAEVLVVEEVSVNDGGSRFESNGHQHHAGSNGHRGLEEPRDNGNWLSTRQLRKGSKDDGKVRAGRVDEDNGFAAWGGYMEAKKAKLDAQLNRNKENKIVNGTGVPSIFGGLAVHINGYVVPPEDELRRMFVAHGGTFHTYRNSKTDYVIATNLSTSSKRLYGSITVKPEWITDSIAAGTLLNYRDYLLYDLNEENKQHTLTQMMGFDRDSKKKTNIASTTVTSNDDPSCVAFDQVETLSAEKVNSTSSNGCAQIPNSSVPISPTVVADSSVNGSDTSEEQIMHHSCDEILAPPEGPVKNTSPGNSSRKVKMATEEGFLEEFYQNSRLHLISDQKKEMQNKIGNMRKNLTDHKFDYYDELKKEYSDKASLPSSFEDIERTLMHIDLDCFFVSVGLLSRPQLRGKPVVVTHSSGKMSDSRSDIASASYEARKYGVRNGMWVAEAKKLCSELEVIPYDFDEYRRVSDKFFDTVSRFTLDIEPLSVDEMVVDATSVLRSLPGCRPERLAEAIRRKVYINLGCTASIGIGSNKLLAKLATKRAKPNGVFHLKDDAASEFIKELEIRELPGVGWSHESKLQQIFGVKYCKDLLEVSEARLKAEFGAKTSEKMLQFCKGIDSSELKYGFDKPKSISADVNYGIRFSTDDELKDFLLKLCKELSSRAVKAQAKGSTLVFKVLCRKKGAGDPKKHGGHGIVDAITRSTKFFKPTSDWGEMYRIVSKMFRVLSIPPADYRGIGFSLTDLAFDFDQQAGPKQPVQKTLFDMANSRGKQMLQQAMKANRKRDAPSAEISVSNSSATASSSEPAAAGSLENCNMIDSTTETSPCLPPKRRKLDFSNVSPTPLPLITANNTRNPPESIDINVLRELPDDLAREVANQYGIDLDDLRSKDKKSLTPPTSAAPEIGISTKTANPYENIDEIDVDYLSALPASVRNEVLIQFQEAKGKKNVSNVSKSPITSSPQPCTSRQAIERENRRREESARRMNGFQSTTPEGNNGGGEAIQEDKDGETDCAYTTPVFNSSSRSSTSQGRFRSRTERGTPVSSKRRLDFSPANVNAHSPKANLSSKHTSNLGGSSEHLDMKRFWREKSYRPEIGTCGTESSFAPLLNGELKDENVRDILRYEITSNPNPSSDDKIVLQQYFEALVERGFIRKTEILLKFLNRKLKSVPEDNPWHNLIQEILNSVQQHCLDLYEHEIDLNT